MKLNLDRETIIKIGGIILLIAILPFAVEFIFLIDVFGLEFAASFMFLYLGMMRDKFLLKLRSLKMDFNLFIISIAKMYLFQPKVFVSHSIGSGVIIALTCSVLLSCTLWIPAIYFSSGIM